MAGEQAILLEKDSLCEKLSSPKNIPLLGNEFGFERAVSRALSEALGLGEHLHKDRDSILWA